jgi:hypothetical protein
MSTDRTFNNMLNEYLTNDLLSETLLKRDWMIQNVAKDNGWKGGSLIVPFYGTTASSIKMGSLTDENDIAKHKYVRGSVSGYKEAWGSIRFEHGDLVDHDGKVNEKSFLKILPTQVEEFGDAFKEQMSKMLLSGSAAATVLNVANANVGILIVDRIERFVLDQKFQLKTSGTNLQTDVYVKSINLNTNELELSLTRGGAAADLTVVAIAVAVSDKFYYDGVLVGGAETNNFSHLKGALLSAANGGSASLYGQTKLAYPYLQAINISGAAITAANIKEKLFEAYNEVRKKARGNADTILMSYKWLGALMAHIETQAPASANFNISMVDKKASLYGWTEIVITSVKGTLKVVGIQEMDDDCIMLLDMSAVKYYSNGELVRKRTAPDGKHYYEKRATTGYYYVVDMCALGELVLLAPTKCGIIHSIP